MPVKLKGRSEMSGPFLFGGYMTDTELDALEAAAKAATPGPWACSDNVHELFGELPFDWWIIYARDQESKCTIPVCRMSQYLCTADEEIAGREAYLKGDVKDPGQSGNNARYIAAANPAVVLEMIAELRQARDYIKAFVEFHQKEATCQK